MKSIKQNLTNMKNLLLILFAACIAPWASAQQDAQFSMNMFNHMTYNPGFAGSNGMTCAQAISRNQWTGFDNHPSTLVFNAHTPFAIGDLQSGAGLNIMSDKLGFEKNLYMSGSYAIRKEVGNGILGTGMSIGFLNKSLNADWVTSESLENSGDAYLDPSIPHMDSQLAFDMGFGLFYMGSIGRDHGYYVGLSATHINRSEIHVDGKAPFNQRHFFLTAQYNYKIAGDRLILKPSFFIENDCVTTQYLFGSLIEIDRKFWTGLFYRGNDAIIAMIGFDFVGGYGIGYAYDITTSKMGKYSSGSHEIILRYCFELKSQKLPTIYGSPRFPN
ncbi:MAG: hypothetical protein A2W91_16905 [Bacteroidetes bacterium GWF2_38_335]|nr:MAG: hypothetical protein A2W91_16905 [Bacteroidetes bacterium GWF2_38_335]OFY81364.1 MAG: hypothetical protein A2281_07880 [Bacteroidetes bacterium RIFOXYA12_FULL_38_20]HBS85487.1 hypothetical protein [Bacteroidales bacterium]